MNSSVQILLLLALSAPHVFAWTNTVPITINRSMQKKAFYPSNELSELFSTVGCDGLWVLREEELPRYSDYMLADTEISTTFENVEIESSSAGGFLKRKLEEACSLNADQVKVVDRMGMDEVRRVFGKDAKVLTVWIKNSLHKRTAQSYSNFETQPLFARFFFFSPAVYQGILTTLILVFIALFGVSWVSSVQTMTRFEPKPKEI